MATTIRQLIMTDWKTRLAAIRTTNGYETNAGLSVFEWREYAFAQDELPAIVIPDNESTVADPGYYAHDHALTVVTSICAGGATTTETLRKILGDVIKCLSGDLSFGGRAYDIEPAGDATTQIHEENRTGDIEYSFVVKYRTPAWDPYNIATA